MSRDRHSSGAAAEQRAAEFIQAAGLRVVERNWACRFGEIDLIARDGDDIVFIEVRCRSSGRFGGALASVDARKRERLIATAGYYLAHLPRAHGCRFDVIAVHADGRCDWVRAAFTA